MSKSNTKGESDLRALIEGLLESGEASIVREENSVVYRIRPTKVGQRHEKQATIEEINETIVNGLSMGEERLKRIYRKKSDLPRPDLPPSAEANLRTKRINTRISPEILDEFQECAKHFGSQREALESAIRLLSSQLGRSNTPKGPRAEPD